MTNAENRSADHRDQDRQTVSKGGLALLVIGALLVAGIIGYRMLPSRVEPAATTVEQDAIPTIAELRERAQADPNNAVAWTDLGLALSDTGDFDGAAQAYRQAIEGDRSNASLWSALGEMRVYASERDPMPPAALDAFREAIKLDPGEPRARYFLAVQKDLTGDHEGAISDWLALLEDTPAGAPWENDLRRTIEQSGKKYDIATAARIAEASKARPAAPTLTAGNAIPGPSREQIDAAGAIPPGEQRDMAVGMVESLDSKLEANPDNVDGWVMLMRSRMTLGETDKAAAALKRAMAANPQARDRLRAEAGALGVPGA